MEKLCDDAEFIADGIVYTDGSAEGWFWKGARAAYSGVRYSKEGKPMWVMRGICGEPHPSINRAELMAVLAVLKMSAGDVVIKIDSACVKKGLAEGEERTTSSRYEAADMEGSVDGFEGNRRRYGERRACPEGKGSYEVERGNGREGDTV